MLGHSSCRHLVLLSASGLVSRGSSGDRNGRKATGLLYCLCDVMEVTKRLRLEIDYKVVCCSKFVVYLTLTDPLRIQPWSQYRRNQTKSNPKSEIISRESRQKRTDKKVASKGHRRDRQKNKNKNRKHKQNRTDSRNKLEATAGTGMNSLFRFKGECACRSSTHAQSSQSSS